MGVRISWLMLARKRLFAWLAASAWLRASARLQLELFLRDDPPPAVHQKLELANVALVVVRWLVADARHGHDPLAVEDGDVHVPEDGHVAVGRAAFAAD